MHGCFSNNDPHAEKPVTMPYIEGLAIIISHNDERVYTLFAHQGIEDEINILALTMCTNRGGCVQVHTYDEDGDGEYPTKKWWDFSYINSGGRIWRVSQDDMWEWEDRAEMSADESYLEPDTHTIRMKPYARTYSVRKYGESDHRHSNRKSSLNYMSFIKRQERRQARRMGKALIREQLHAHAA